MTKAEARLIEALTNDAWIALAHSDGVGAAALVKDAQKEMNKLSHLQAPTLGETATIDLPLATLECRINTAAQIVARIREAARDELSETQNEPQIFLKGESSTANNLIVKLRRACVREGLDLQVAVTPRVKG